jgi:aspartyl-tRNA(Asn)/glutamyl-tRNA(Gln) amidotransferase subunit A
VIDMTRELDGELVTVKELIDVAGQETTANSDVILPDRFRFPDSDAPVVDRLRRAGATIGAKTVSHEFAWGITTAQPGRKRATNPRAPGRVTGGSSGGAAQSVASGDAWAAVGTDTGGSIRIPAAWCGIVGWKPSAGLISTDGVLPLAPSLDHVGFLAADVASIIRIARLWGVESSTDASAAAVARLRIESPSDHASGVAVDAAAAALCSERAEHPAFDMAGEELVTCYAGIQLAEALSVHQSTFGVWPDQADRYAPDVRARLERASALTDAEAARAREMRADLRQRVDGWMTDVDVLILPTTGCPPPTLDRPDEAIVDQSRFELRDVVMPHTVLANLVGLPAVALPWGVDGDGLPVSVQLVGRRGGDGLLLAVAASLATFGPR